MRNFLEYAYDDAMMLDKLGMFSTLKFGQKLIKKIRGIINRKNLH